MPLFSKKPPKEDPAAAELTRRWEKGERFMNIYDRGAWLIYDWLRIDRGTTTRARYECMAEPFYDSGPNGYPRGRGETNVAWTPDRGLPQPSIFVAQSIHMLYGAASVDDLQTFREHYAAEFQIMQKIFYTVPLMAIPAHGVVLPDEPNAPVPEDAPLQPHDFGDYPRIIPPGVFTAINFEGTPFTLSEAGRGLAVLPLIRGLYDRPVE